MKITPFRILPLATLLFLGLQGCGGGGGGSGGGVPITGGTTATPGGSTAQSVGTVAEVQGNVGFPLGSSSSVSRNSVSRTQKTVQRVSLQEGNKSPLQNVAVKLYAVRDDPGLGEVSYLLLGEGVSNQAGNYSVRILETATQNLLSLSKTNYVTSLEALYTSTHRIKVTFSRRSLGGVPAIEKSLSFRPAVNNRVLGNTSEKVNLTVNADIDFSADQNLKLEVHATKELEEWEGRLKSFREDFLVNSSGFDWNPNDWKAGQLAERLVIQEDVDLDGNGFADADEGPLVVFEKPQIKADFQPKVRKKNAGDAYGTDVVSIIEVDGDGNGTFNEGADQVSSRVFGGESGRKISSFVDLFGEGALLAETVVASLDITPPTLTIVSPLPATPPTEVSGDMSIILTYSDDTAFDLSSLKVWFNEKVEFLSPVRFTLAPGANFANQANFTKDFDSQGGFGIAKFTLINVIFALGPRSHTLFASIKDFAGTTSTAISTFVVNAAPEFDSNNPRIVEVSEGTQVFTTALRIFDVDPLDIQLGLLGGGSLPATIFLTAEGFESPSSFIHEMNPKSSAPTGEVTVYLNVQSNENLALDKNRVLEFTAIDNVSDDQGGLVPGTAISFALTLRPIENNNSSNFAALCWVNSPASPYQLSPQNVCKELGGSTEQTYCRTSGSSTLPLVIDENKLAQFVLCGSELDREDKISYSFSDIVRLGSGDLTIDENVPQFDAEFFFRSPTTLNYYQDPQDGSVKPSSLSTQSTISFLEWKPFGNRFRDENILRFRATDEKGISGVQTCLGELNTSSNLVAHYGFEGKSPTAVIDSSKNSNSGIINGATRVKGVVGQALSFDGISNTVQISQSVRPAIRSTMSLAVWVQVGTPGVTSLSDGLLLEELDGAYFLETRAQGATASVSFTLSTNQGTKTLGGGSLIPGEWSHVEAVYDGTQISLFLNGIEIASTAHSGNLVTGTNPQLKIGSSNFKGLLDEVRLYNRALNQTSLQEEATCVESSQMSVVLSVTTVEDPPQILSLSTLGLVTGAFPPETTIYARQPFAITVQKNPDFFEPFRTGSPAPLFKAQQGESISITFGADDDENRFSEKNVDGNNSATALLVVSDIPSWLSLSTEPTPGLTNYILTLEGTPTSADAVKIQTIAIESQDPGGKADFENLYRFEIEILDQNDKPQFLNLASDAVLPVPVSTATQEIVTLTLSATEDTPLTFWVHAFDRDPSPPTSISTSPYWNPNLFTFAYDAPALAQIRTPPDKIIVEPYSSGLSYRSARIQWTPQSGDTAEDKPAGVGGLNQARFLVQTVANCPARILLIDGCKTQSNFINVLIDVRSIDEAPKFEGLFRDNIPVLETDGTIHQSRIVDLQEGVSVELKHGARDEENQPINNIKIRGEDTSLSSFKSNFVLLNVAAGNQIGVGSQSSFIVMTGSPTIRDYINVDPSVSGAPVCSLPLWVTNVKSDCRPPVVTMTLEIQNTIGATGETTSASKVLSFRVVDVADPLNFVDPTTADPAVRFSSTTTNVRFNGTINLTADEDQVFNLDLAAYNSRDKDPKLWSGFQFSIVQFPDPPGDMSIDSHSLDTDNTTAVLTWTPRQEHVDGTEDRVHDVIVRACIRDPQRVDPTIILPSSCRDQTYKINVNAAADAPVIFFGDDLRSLITNPITSNNPFVIFEDSVFEKLIRVEDEDLQAVNVQISLLLSDLPGQRMVLARSVGSVLSSTNETLTPGNDNPIDGDEDLNFVETQVRWSSIDADDIYFQAQSQGYVDYFATYVLRITGNTRGVSDASGKTVTDVYLEVRSVNDIPSFTTGTLPAIRQGEPAGAVAPSLDLTNVVINEEGDALDFTLVDKGTAVDFLEDLSSGQLLERTHILHRLERTHILHLLGSPGENGVGNHNLTIKVEEQGNPDQSTIANLILPVTDSNDPLRFETNALFSGVRNLVEGDSITADLDVFDADLSSAAAEELITFAVVGDFSSSFSNPTTLFSHGVNFATTSDFSFTGTTVAAAANSSRAIFRFTFSPQRLSSENPFAVTSYFLQFTARDRFKQNDVDSCQPDAPPCPKSDITTIAFSIDPRDDTPVFSSVAGRPIGTEAITPVCITTPSCFGADFYIQQSYSPGPFPHFLSITAIDQETEPLGFSFVQPFADSTTSTLLNLSITGTPFSVTPAHPATPDSIRLSFTPTNGNVGLQIFALKVTDPGDVGGSSINSSKGATHAFSFFVQNVADPPTLTEMRHGAFTGITSTKSTSPLILYEDRVEEILVLIDDLDLHLPQAFTSREEGIISTGFNFGKTATLDLANSLFPKEFFSYELLNLTTFTGLQIQSPSENTTNSPSPLFAFSSPANIVSTATTDRVKINWAPPDNFTFPKFSGTEFGAAGGDMIWQLRINSFSSNSVISTRPSSITTEIHIRVFPVNDAPKIANTDTEALATQDIPFEFEIQGLDEEENSLLYFFDTPLCNANSAPPVVPPSCVPGDMNLQGNTLKWNPINDDTISGFYDLRIFGRDTGKISNVSVSGLPTSTPLTSPIYFLRVFLNDADDPVIRDGSINPGIKTSEDTLYVSNIRYVDPDFNEVLQFGLFVAPQGMTIEDDDLDGNATIKFPSPQPGLFNVTIQVNSLKNSALRSTVFFSYVLEVTPVNDAPVFQSLPKAILIENIPYIYNIDVTDEDDSSVLLDLVTTDLPQFGITCDSNPGRFVELFASDRKLLGSTNLMGFETQESSLASPIVTTLDICIEASDGLAKTTQSFTLMVQANNNPPTVQSMVVSTDSMIIKTPGDLHTEFDSEMTSTVVSEMVLKLATNPCEVVHCLTKLNQSEILFEPFELVNYKDPSQRSVKMFQGVANYTRIVFSDEEGDLPIQFDEIKGPGSIIDTEEDTATLTLIWTPSTADIASPPFFSLQAKDVRNRQTTFSYRATIIDAPDLPTVTFNKAVQFVDENSAQTLELEGRDLDLKSVLSYSIVTNPLDPHPVIALIKNHPFNHPALDLEVSNQGSVTFLAKVSQPVILGSATDLIPVTFSVCGTSRTSSTFASDCITATYSYRILSRNDPPFFSPSIPATSKTTAKEGNINTNTDRGYGGGKSRGLTFRKVYSQNHCPSETSEEICIVDEESTLPENLFGANPKVELSLTIPEVPPAVAPGAPSTSGLRLTDPTSSCYVPSTGTLCPVSTVAFACNLTAAGCSSAVFTVIQTLVWDVIPFKDSPSVMNLEITANETADSSKLSTFTFSLEIENTNQGPLINHGFPLIPEQTTEGDTFQFSLAENSFDEDGDSLVFELLQGVSAMTINTNNGLITWNPTVSHIGNHLVELRVTDHPPSGPSLSFTTNFQITVNKQNSPPIIEAGFRNINDISELRTDIATEGSLFEAKIFAFDEEGDSFSFFSSLSTLNGNPLPSGFDLTSFGRISWTPGNSNVGANVLNIFVQDTASGSSSSREFTLTVKNVNNPPQLTNPITNVQTVDEQASLSYAYQVSEQDSADVAIFSVKTTPTLSSRISPSGVLSINPEADDSGNYVVEVSVSDLGGLTDSNTFTLQVLQKNNPPVLEKIAQPLYVSRSTVYTHQLFASDPEADPITFSFASKPEGVAIDPSSGLISVTPLPGEPNTKEFEVFCKDSLGQESERKTVKLKFTDQNPPTITSIPSPVGKVLSPYTYTIEANVPVFSTQLLEGPLGMVSPQGENIIRWTPAFESGVTDQSGVYVIVLRITAVSNEETLESDPQRYTLTVNKENTPPVLELAKDVDGNAISIYDASQDIAFLQTVMTIKDSNPEDLGRLDFYFNTPLKTKVNTANSLSNSQAEILEVSGSRILNNNLAELKIELSWKPDNGAAFAVTDGQVNRFSVIASDGIAESPPLSLEFNVTNKNDTPVFFSDENQGSSEIGFVGNRYTREFFARDLDKQLTYFCLDTSTFIRPGEDQTPPIYPSLRPTQLNASGTGLELGTVHTLGFLTDQPYLFGATDAPSNSICVRGEAVVDFIDPHPERGKLSKVTFYWDPTEANIFNEPFEDLPLYLWDAVLTGDFNQEPKFTLKLAPEIQNIVPNTQYIGKEVLISGGGIVLNENQLNIEFLRSNGTISAVTEVFGISETKPGQGKFIVPQGAVSGFVSVGFTSFSTPVPFTVLNGKTSVIAGKTKEDTDLLSSPSGLAVTFISATTSVILVSNMEGHTIHGFLRDETNKKTENLGILAGQLTVSGDTEGQSPLFNSPTGLSIAHRKGKIWLLIADTENHKIKAMDLSDFYLPDAEKTLSYPTYTIASSTHLNRPYMAIQHMDPTLPDYFYIANTFNNTIELAYAGSSEFASLPNRENDDLVDFFRFPDTDYGAINTSPAGKTLPNWGDLNLTGSKNTYTVAGTGFSRTDILGNLFHPIDLVMIQPNKNTPGEFKLLVSSYSNHKYSFNNSFKIDLYSSPDRNKPRADNPDIRFQSASFYTHAISLGDYGSTSSGYDGELLFVSQGTQDDWITTRSIDIVRPTQQSGRTDKGLFYITGAEALYTDSSQLSKQVSESIFNTHFTQIPNQASLQRLLYQTYELNFTGAVNMLDFVQNPNPDLSTNKAAIWAQPGTQEISVTPINDTGVYEISGLVTTKLPSEIGSNELGDPFYYDTNQDYIDDLWLPVPELGAVYVFPGTTAAPPAPPLTFDTENYWYITSESFGFNCQIGDCLKGVRQVTMGRFMGQYVHQTSASPEQGPLHINEPIARGDDLILISDSDLDNGLKIVDGYGWTGNVVSGNITPTLDDDILISDYKDYHFHINHENTTPSGFYAIDFPNLMPTGATWVDFSRSSGNPPDTDPAYNYVFIRLENKPFEACLGHFTNYAFRQGCSTVNEDGKCAAEVEGGDSVLEDITLAWTGLDDFSTPSWQDTKKYMLNLEQILLRCAPAADSNEYPLVLIGNNPVGDASYSLEVKDLAIGRVHCGQPLARGNRVIGARQTEKTTTLNPSGGTITATDYRAFTSQVDDFGKPDSFFFITSKLEFKMMDMMDDVFFETPKYQSWPGADTLLKDGKGNLFKDASDFLIYDFSGDNNPDLVVLHPQENKISIRLGSGSSAGRLFAEDDPNQIQVLNTLANPTSVDLIKTTSNSSPFVMDLLVTNKDANSVSVFQRLPANQLGPGAWFSNGVHLNVGNTGNLAARSVIVTDTLYLGTEANNLPTTLSSGLATLVWDHYYDTLNASTFAFFHSGILPSQITSHGMVSVQNSPLKTVSELGSFLLTPGLIFRTTRSVQATTIPIYLETLPINDDDIFDLVAVDPLFEKFTVFLSNNGRSLTYSPNAETYDTDGVAGGVGFGDLDRAYDNNPGGVNATHQDLVISNFDRDSITIFFNGGAVSSGINKDFSFSHGGFPKEVISVGKGPRGVTVIDLNLDGHLDIAVANQTGNNISVIYNKGEVGRFVYADPIYYSVGFSPLSIQSLRTRTHLASPNSGNMAPDLVVLNQSGESLSILLNRHAQGVNGFEPPRQVNISEYFPSHNLLLDTVTEQPVDPFNRFPRHIESGDFGNITNRASQDISSLISLPPHTLTEFVTETQRYENFVVANERMIYNLKNIGAKEYSAYQAAITSFHIDPLGILHVDSQTRHPQGVVKSLMTSGSRVYWSHTLVSDSIWQGQSGTDSTLFTTSYLHSATIFDSLISADISEFATNQPSPQTAFDIRQGELGSSLEALVFVSNPYTHQHKIYGLHSGENKGVLELSGLDSNSIQADYVVNSQRITPQPTQPGTYFFDQVSLFNPSGMTLDPNKVSILLADSGNEFIRIIDRDSNVTRTMPVLNPQNPVLNNIIDITNVRNTFNYYVISSDRKLYLVNPSNDPITATTQTLSVEFSADRTSQWFKIESRQNLLYIASRNQNGLTGKILRIDLDTTPLNTTSIQLADDSQGNPQNFDYLGGFTLSEDGNRLYFSEKNNSQIKVVDLSQSDLNPVTLAGIKGINGHFDGPNTSALLGNPGDLALNQAEDKLFFIDGSTIRSVNLELVPVGEELEVSTISGDPLRTGIINGDGQRARFISPSHLLYELRDQKDVLYISDTGAHNIRKVEIDP